MSYQLGVDLGTTYTAAAVGRQGRVEISTLGTSSPVMPSVVLLRADGEVLVGEVAVRRGLAEPTRVGREFKRRLGDPTPLVLGGTPYGAEALMSHLLRAVIKGVTEREGEAPDRVVLTHPANFGPYKLDMMREVARLAGLDLNTTSFLTEPQAAAISYAARNRVEAGQVVAVYDFGGGTFDAALVQRTDRGFGLIGRPEGMERFGGIDIDAAIVNHVDQVLGGAIGAMNPDDPEVQAGVARLREDCRAAKEALSSDTDTSINVSLPNLQTQVRLTRGELEEMVRPRLRETIDALNRAVRSAGIGMEQVSRILLVGGSSRMPIVAETIQRETGRPVAMDAHPKFAIALGAASLGVAAPQLPPVPVQGSTPPASPPPQQQQPQQRPTPTAQQQPQPQHAQQAPPQAFGAQQRPPGQPPLIAPAAKPSSSPDKRKLAIIGAAAAVVIAVVAFIALRGGDEGSATPPGRTEDTTADTTADTEPDVTDPTTPETDPTTPDSTGPTAPVITGSQLQAALLTVDDLDGGFAAAPIFDSPDEFCGQLPARQPVTDQTVFFNKFAGTVEEQDLQNTISVFASAADADAVFEQQVGIVQNCTGLTEEVNGITFDVTMIASRLGANVLGTFPEVCGEGALAVINLANAEQNLSISSTVWYIRCGNIITQVSMTVGPAADSTSSNNSLVLAAATSVDKVSALPIVS